MSDLDTRPAADYACTVRTALVLCPSWDLRHPTYAPALLAALLRSRGHEPLLFDLNKDFALHAEAAGDPSAKLEPLWANCLIQPRRLLDRFAVFFEEYAARVAGSRAAVVGFTALGSNIAMSRALARRVKALNPGLFVVFGGPSCFSPDVCAQLVKNDVIDAVVPGEGDRAFPDLVDALDVGRSASSVAGVLTRRSSGPPAVPTVLDDLPTPDFSIYNLGLYPQRELTLETSRGCVRRCDFCSDWRNWRRFRRKSPTRIAAQMRELLGCHSETRGFLFADSIVNGDISSLATLADALIAEGSLARWSGYAIVRPEMTASFLEKLRRAGAWNLFYGVETGSEAVSLAMGKRVSPQLNSRVLRATREAGMTNVVFIMVGHPSEGEAEFEETLDFIRRNASSIGCLSVSMCNTDPMDEQAIARYGIAHPGPYWSARGGQNDFCMRLDRFRRVHRTAYDHGIEVYVHNRSDPTSHEFYYETVLAEYHLAMSNHLEAATHLVRLHRLETAWRATGAGPLAS